MWHLPFSKLFNELFLFNNKGKNRSQNNYTQYLRLLKNKYCSLIFTFLQEDPYYPLHVCTLDHYKSSKHDLLKEKTLLYHQVPGLFWPCQGACPRSCLITHGDITETATGRQWWAMTVSSTVFLLWGTNKHEGNVMSVFEEKFLVWQRWHAVQIPVTCLATALAMLEMQ